MSFVLFIRPSLRRSAGMQHPRQRPFGAKPSSRYQTAWSPQSSRSHGACGSLRTAEPCANRATRKLKVAARLPRRPCRSQRAIRPFSPCGPIVKGSESVRLTGLRNHRRRQECNELDPSREPSCHERDHHQHPLRPTLLTREQAQATTPRGRAASMRSTRAFRHRLRGQPLTPSSRQPKRVSVATTAPATPRCQRDHRHRRRQRRRQELHYRCLHPAGRWR